MGLCNDITPRIINKMDMLINPSYIYYAHSKSVCCLIVNDAEGKTFRRGHVEVIICTSYKIR